MSDHDELKAAVERYRKQRKQQGYLHCHRGHVDLLMLADAYLARLAEDEAGDEPVTEELLMESFGAVRKPNLLGVWIEHLSGLRLHLYGRHDDAWYVDCWQDDSDVTIAVIRTRRQLRRLIEALEGR